MLNFNAKVIVSEQMDRLMVLAAQELACKVVYACGEHYSFNAEEAINLLGLGTVKVLRNKQSNDGKVSNGDKVVSVKSSFPLPYSGECNDALCHGLCYNNCLFTQCQAQIKCENQFCKSHQLSADKNGGIPEYGTIEQRQAVGIFEYVDSKGRKPISYTKIMKKYKVSKEQVLVEAGKMNIIVDVNHFEEYDGKHGRPSSKKEKEVKMLKGAKGRPKKTKKVLEIEGEEDDLFASLVASANLDDEEEENEDENESKEAKLATEKEENLATEKEENLAAEKESKESKLAVEKELKVAKEAQRLKEKEEKESKLAAEKESKEAKLAAEKELKAAKEAQRLKEKEEKEAKLFSEKEVKEAKLAAEKEAKVAKEAQRLKEKEEKEAAKAAKKAPESNAVEEEVEADVVKKIEFAGKKYLKSKKTGIIYDYKEYVTNCEQIVVGKWNVSKNKIDFTEAEEEEEEEEYEEED
jgi:hypothetical protein